MACPQAIPPGDNTPMTEDDPRRSQRRITTEDGRVYFDMAEEHSPCDGCGVCCRHFRVSFYQGELDSQPGGWVPAELAVPVTPFRVCMKGTETGQQGCVAQREDGRCGIYEQRPSVCREFPVFMEDGSMNPECLRLQAMYDVKPR